MKKAKQTTEAMKKTSIKLPHTVWREAQILAIDTDREFQEIVATALAEYLKRQKEAKR